MMPCIQPWTPDDKHIVFEYVLILSRIGLISDMEYWNAVDLMWEHHWTTEWDGDSWP